MDLVVFIIVCVIGLLLVSVSIGGLVFMHSKFTEQLSSLQSELSRLKKDIRGVCTGAVGISQRLTALSGSLKDLSVRQDSAELKEPGLSSYSHAIKVVEMGGSVDDIVQGCGLNRAEAELVAVLHRKKS